MRLRSLLEAPTGGHRQQLLAMQQDLLEQGWDDAIVKPSTVVAHAREHVAKYNLELKSGTHTVRLAGMVEPDYSGDIGPYLSWYASCKMTGTAYGPDTSDEIEPQGEEHDHAVECLGRVLLEMQALDALNKEFEVLRKDVINLPGRSYAISFELSTPRSHRNYATVLYPDNRASNFTGQPTLWWSNHQWGQRSINSHRMQAVDIPHLIKVCHEGEAMELGGHN